MNDHASRLSPLEYDVTQNKATEPPFTGKFYKNTAKGTYHCIVCGRELFSSATKFESGSGWPSFYDVLASDSVKTAVDTSHDMERTEVMCAHCGAHLGHIFPDGPDPTGLRYCVNSASLSFEPDSGASKKNNIKQ